jgi:hypothetical protein
MIVEEEKQVKESLGKEEIGVAACKHNRFKLQT